MSLLLPYDVNSESRNKYLNYFFESLTHNGINIIASTKPWLNKLGEYEAVLIHWPEHLPRLENQSDYEFLEFTIDRLKYFKKFSKILYFVHNEKPHKFLKKTSAKLYEKVIYSSYAIYHFSDFSKNLYDFKYKSNKKQFVIPHGNYTKLDNDNNDKKQLFAGLKFVHKKKNCYQYWSNKEGRRNRSFI